MSSYQIYVGTLTDFLSVGLVIENWCQGKEASTGPSRELVEHVPKGNIPRTMTVHFRGELTRKVAPGDVVELSGIFLPIPYTGFREMRAGLVANTYLEAMSVSHFKKKYEEYELKGDEEEQIVRLAEDGDIYSKLARSLAPEIFGHEDIKKAFLLLLVINLLSL
ncbi:DNA replication licensing factor MCM7 [Artemisia annua]|uniref:DNA replication licensing factor MCM7 n=1 Tax=Artemisia annua TaxID=35608 RepID=A0A2U1MV01_ARTAN|nr:DNA replication licensing factor MCM7 [Artemisia annua]